MPAVLRPSAGNDSSTRQNDFFVVVVADRGLGGRFSVHHVHHDVAINTVIGHVTIGATADIECVARGNLRHSVPDRLEWCVEGASVSVVAVCGDVIVGTIGIEGGQGE